ncbi:metal-dependent hydrolase [Halorussus halobius]|uniref:metal-dependent hydrolase n=1 Tax=Halorussus halobius TaxID=1710537 RepID=UPI0010926723|nr:metal-dependent hydrolase [Halorussus halobius]
MWPWGHLAVGYLVYSLAVRLRERRPPTGPAAIALAFGTQFPDLVDKPLAWTVDLLPNGRSLAHSLLAALLVVVAVGVVLRRWHRGGVATAFGVGYLTHLFGDALPPAVSGDVDALGFLAWPLAPPVEYGTEQSFAAHLGELGLDAVVSVEFGLAAAVVALWLVDGAPGARTAAAVPRWVGRKLST